MLEEQPNGMLPPIRRTYVLNAPIQKVWEAVATSEGMAEWFMPNDIRPVKGHEFTLQTPFGISHCKVTELDPPHRLAFTWGEDWQVSFEMEEREGKTQLTLIHSGWKEGKVAEETSEEHSVIRNRMDQGWGTILDKRLRKAVEA